MKMLPFKPNERQLFLPNDCFNLLIDWMESIGYIEEGEIVPGNVGKEQKEQIRSFLTIVAARFNGSPITGAVVQQDVPVSVKSKKQPLIEEEEDGDEEDDVKPINFAPPSFDF